MSLSESLTIVKSALPAGTSRRKLRAAAVTYLNWWNGHSEASGYSDPTGNKAVRRILAQQAAKDADQEAAA